MQSGFQTTERAKVWAENHGHATIWYWHRMERVYWENPEPQKEETK
jgi:hypothetical protein